jgi:vesicle coat complex subunit
LQRVIDENKIVKIIPKDLDSFFKVCFILDNLNKIPENANLWLMYLLSYIDKKRNLEEISQIVYCIDFLYSKISLKHNELNQLILKIKELLRLIKNYQQKNGYFISSPKFSPLEETRFALFSINLIEDLIQDMIFYYNATDLKPIKRIYENVKDVKKVSALITT